MVNTEQTRVIVAAAGAAVVDVFAAAELIETDLLQLNSVVVLSSIFHDIFR